MRPALARILLLAAAAMLLVACSSGGTSTATTVPIRPTSDAPNPGNPGLKTTSVRYDGGELTVEIADTPESRAEGLADRDSLPRDSGMLFDLEKAGTTSFWMKGMRFALDMVWIDENRRIVGVTANVPAPRGTPAEQLPLYPSPDTTRYVLEVNAGVASDRSLDEGTELAFTLP